MVGPPAQELARRYMEQPWGGKAAMPYRHLLAQIGEEARDILRRCPECEEPYIPYLAAWPTHSSTKPKKHGVAYRARRYLICPYCGHRAQLHTQQRPRQRILTDEQLHEVMALYEAGMGPREIGKRYFVHYTTVREYLRRAGVKLRPLGGSEPLRGVSHRELETIRFLYENLGWTQEQIAKFTGMTKSQVSTRAKWGGMTRRGAKARRRVKLAPKRKVAV